MMQAISGDLGMTVLVYTQSMPAAHALAAMLSAMGCTSVAMAGSPDAAREVLSAQAVDATLVIGTENASSANEFACDHENLPVIILGDAADPVANTMLFLAKPLRLADLESGLKAARKAPAAMTPAAVTG